MKQKKLSKSDRIRARKILKKYETILNRQEEYLKKSEIQTKQIDKELKENAQRIRKMKMSNMWLGFIMGFVTIVLVTTIIAIEIMSVNPNLLVIVIDLFAFFMSVNLIYQSFKTRHELRNQMQEEILNELERD